MKQNFVLETLLVYFENELLNNIKIKKNKIFIYLKNKTIAEIEIKEKFNER